MGKSLPWFAKCMFTFFCIQCKPDMHQQADNAQHTFSSKNVLTLYHAIPSLEALYRAWSSQAVHPKYQPFATALHAACEKINEYYKKTMQSPTYILSMSMSPYCILCTHNVTDLLLF